MVEVDQVKPSYPFRSMIDYTQHSCFEIFFFLLSIYKSVAITHLRKKHKHLANFSKYSKETPIA